MSTIARRLASSVARGSPRPAPGPSPRRPRETRRCTGRCIRAATRRLLRRVDRLVVHVREVHDVAHRVALLVLQRAAQHVEADERPEVADVAARVDRQAARVHADGPAVGRHELFFGAGQRVVEAHAEHGRQRAVLGRARCSRYCTRRRAVRRRSTAIVDAVGARRERQVDDAAPRRRRPRRAARPARRSRSAATACRVGRRPRRPLRRSAPRPRAPATRYVRSAGTLQRERVRHRREEILSVQVDIAGLTNRAEHAGPRAQSAAICALAARSSPSNFRSSRSHFTNADAHPRAVQVLRSPSSRCVSTVTRSVADRRPHADARHRRMLDAVDHRDRRVDAVGRQQLVGRLQVGRRKPELAAAASPCTTMPSMK